MHAFLTVLWEFLLCIFDTIIFCFVFLLCRHDHAKVELFTSRLQETEWVTPFYLVCFILFGTYLPSCLTALCSTFSGSHQWDSRSGGGASTQGNNPGFLCQVWWDWSQVFRRPWSRPFQHRCHTHLQPHAFPERGSQVCVSGQPAVLFMYSISQY